jgi:hypothetical protein
VLQRGYRESGRILGLHVDGEEYYVMIEGLILQGGDETEIAVDVRVELKGSIQEGLVVSAAASFDPFGRMGWGQDYGEATGFTAMHNFEDGEDHEGQEGHGERHGEHHPYWPRSVGQHVNGEPDGEHERDGEGEE